jgi:hypothetical protein
MKTIAAILRCGQQTSEGLVALAQQAAALTSVVLDELAARVARQALGVREQEAIAYPHRGHGHRVGGRAALLMELVALNPYKRSHGNSSR